MSRGFEMIMQDQKMELYRLETEPFGTNAYLIICRKTKESVLIDAPGDVKIIEDQLKDTRLKYILITHGHMDHTMALEELYNKLGVPLAVHEHDAGMLPINPDLLLNDGDVIDCGQISLEVTHVPGHTPGSICFRVENYLLSGDTIFPGGPGKTATPEDFKTIVASIKDRILVLPDETIILPGHGISTTIETEKEQFQAFSSRVHDDRLCGDITWLES